MRHGSRLCAQVCFRITLDTGNHLTDIPGLGLTRSGLHLLGSAKLGRRPNDNDHAMVRSTCRDRPSSCGKRPELAAGYEPSAGFRHCVQEALAFLCTRSTRIAERAVPGA
jgi:hypothetical protein